MKQPTLNCEITCNTDVLKMKQKGKFIKIEEYFNTWFALIIISGKLERIDLEEYNVKIV